MADDIIDFGKQDIAGDDVQPDHSHGQLRLRHELTNEIILIPQPSNDPNDPLNWYVFEHI